MKIKDLLEMDIGQELGGDGSDGLLFSIKTFKKVWQAGDIWVQQVILMDKTGEIPADINVGNVYTTLRGQASGREIRILQGQIQEAEWLGKDRRKLYVDQYSVPTTIGDPPQKEDFRGEETKVIRGKVKCWLVAAKTQQTGTTIEDVLEFSQDEKLDEIIDSIMEG